MQRQLGKSRLRISYLGGGYDFPRFLSGSLS